MSKWWKPVDWHIRYIGTGDFWFDEWAKAQTFGLLRHLPKFGISRKPIVYKVG